MARADAIFVMKQHCRSMATPLQRRRWQKARPRAACRPAAAERRGDAVALRRRHAAQRRRSRCAARRRTPACGGCAAKSVFRRRAAQRSRRRSSALRRAAPLRHTNGERCAPASWRRAAAHAPRGQRARDASERGRRYLASLAALQPCSGASANVRRIPVRTARAGASGCDLRKLRARARLVLPQRCVRGRWNRKQPARTDGRRE